MLALFLVNRANEQRDVVSVPDWLQVTSDCECCQSHRTVLSSITKLRVSESCSFFLEIATNTSNCSLSSTAVKATNYSLKHIICSYLWPMFGKLITQHYLRWKVLSNNVHHVITVTRNDNLLISINRFIGIIVECNKLKKVGPGFRTWSLWCLFACTKKYPFQGFIAKKISISILCCLKTVNHTNWSQICLAKTACHCLTFSKCLQNQ